MERVVEELNSREILTSGEYKRLLDAGMRMYRATPMRIAEQANQRSRAAYRQGLREGYLRERAAMSSFLQAKPGRAIFIRDGEIRTCRTLSQKCWLAIKKDKSKAKMSETLIAVVAAVASMGVLGLVV